MTTVSLTWLGQAGFLLEARGQRITIDPFLSDHPARLYTPPPVEPFVKNIDWFFSTHSHVDHLDLEFMERVAKESPRLRVSVPSPSGSAAELAVSGVSGTVVTVQPGDRLDLGPAKSHVTVIPAHHALDAPGELGPGLDALGRAHFVGYLFEFEGLTVYHSGDTVLFPELLEILGRHSVDIALLPVNGRDYFREEAGIVGNLDAAEAAILAAAIGASILIPMHWDLFAGNTVRPSGVVDVVVDRALELHVVIPTRWRPLTLGVPVKQC
jgi:L-ascorbate 6-phosphate lactonase